ncbi:MAG TPA: RNA polymerase sigma factor [Anaerolineales bacterium]
METDTTLLLAAKRMDEDALIKIFDTYSAPLFSYVFHLCGDAVLADHIVGDVFVKLLEQLTAGNGPTDNLRSYLYQTAYHRMIDEVRYSRRRVPLEVADWLYQAADSTALPLDDRVLFKQMLNAIREELTDDQRHVIVLRFLEGCSLRETAAILGKRLDHVKVIQTRAVAVLRRVLEYRDWRRAVPARAVAGVPRSLGA